MPTLMYANVLNASSRRGVWTSSRISGSSSSIWATMLPIGSSTSGIQTSSIPDMPRRLAFAHAPRDLRGDEDHQHAEQPPEHVLRERLGECDAALDAADRRQADHDCRPPAHVAVPLLAPGAREHGRDDREQRARLSVELRQAEREGQRRHEEDAAADAEQARQHAGDEPDQDEKHLRIVQGTVDTEQVLVQLAQRPAETAVLLDVDGTLAPIVSRPEDAVVPEATRALVGQLAGRYALVACVSGRPGDEVRKLVGVDGIVY